MRYRQLLIFLYGIAGLLHANAQEVVTLDRVLDHLSEKEGVSIAYDYELLQQAHADIDTSDLTLTDFQIWLEGFQPFRLESISEDNWVLKPVKVAYEMRLSGQHGEEINEAIMTLALNRKVIPFSYSSDLLVFEYQPRAGDTLYLNVIGYKNSIIPVSQLLSSTRFDFLLSPLHVQLADVTVVDFITKGISIDPSDQRISIDTDELPLLPGETDGDLFASLVSIPGISTPDNRAGNLYIRGSSTDQSYVLFDNIPIYHRGHYYGTISPYNPRIIDQVDVNRGGFHPRLGGRVGGAVNIQSQDATTSGKNYGLALNTLYGLGFAKLLSADSTVGISFGARRAYPTSFKSPKLKAISEAVFDASAAQDRNGNVTETLDVDFQDYQASVALHPSDKTSIKVTGLYTSSYTSYIQVNDLPESNQFVNTGGNLSINQTLGDKWSGQIDLTVSDYKLEFDTELEPLPQPGPPRPEPRSINQLKDVKFKAESGYVSNKGNQLQLGLEYMKQQVIIDYLTYVPAANPNLPDVPYTYFDDHTGKSAAAFVNYQWLTHKKWYAQAGSRLSYYAPLKQWQPSPRLFVSYDVTNSFTLKSSAGRYYQVLSQVQDIEFSSGGFSNQMWVLAGIQDGHVLTSNQWMSGALLSAGKWMFDLEVYSKSNNDATYASGNQINRRIAFLKANQVYRGLDLTIKKSWGDYATSWLGYSYIDGQVIFDTLDYGTYDDKYAQPHILFLGGSYIREQFKLSVGWKLASGASTRTFDFYRLSQIYINNPVLDPADDPTIGLPHRYDPVHMLDISMSYILPKSEKRHFKSTFGLSVVNSYNADNLTDQVYRITNGTSPTLINRSAIGFAPNLMVTIEW